MLKIKFLTFILIFVLAGGPVFSMDEKDYAEGPKLTETTPLIKSDNSDGKATDEDEWCDCGKCDCSHCLSCVENGKGEVRCCCMVLGFIMLIPFL